LYPSTVIFIILAIRIEYTILWYINFMYMTSTVNLIYP
jgi:hypothetical protein